MIEHELVLQLLLLLLENRKQEEDEEGTQESNKHFMLPHVISLLLI